MSREVDERVVSMQFDNANFEKNVTQSMSTLDKLKSALRLTESSKGLEGISDAASKVNFSGLSDGIDTVKMKFSALQVMGITALQNITNSVINTGRQITQRILAPIKSGGKNRALNIEQAMFQAEGLGMDPDKIIEDANYAVDGTAYGLDAAAKVAAQLGASGLKSGEDMKRALRAVSGVAAMTGSSYEDMGNVFTKVAGQGRVMGDDLLRLSSRGLNGAAAIAKATGKTEKQIREMVTAGKVDFQMFADAMDSAFGEHAGAANKTFTGSLANMKSALGRIGANFYQPLHKNLIDPFNTLRENINEVNKRLEPAFKVLTRLMENTSQWFSKTFKADQMDYSGVEKFVGIIVKGLESLEKVNLSDVGTFFGSLGKLASFSFSWLKPLGQAFKEIFPKREETNGFGEFVEKFAQFTSGLKLSEGTLDKFKSTFRGIFAVVDIMGMFAVETLSALGRGLQSLGVTLGPLGSGVLDMSAGFGEWLVNLRDVIKESGAFRSVYDGIGKGLSFMGDTLSAFWKHITGFKIEIGGWTGFTDFLKDMMDIIGKAGQAIWDFGGEIKDVVGDVFSKNVVDFASVGILGGLLKIGSVIADKFENVDLSIGMFDKIKSVMDTLKDTLVSYQNQLKAETLKSLATAIAILAGSMLVLSLIDIDDMIKASVGMGAMMGMLVLMSEKLSKIEDPRKSAGKVVTMLGAVTSLLILAAAMKVLSTIDAESMIRGLFSIATLMGIMVGTMKMLQTQKGTVTKGSGQMLVMAMALTAMTVPLKIIGSMDVKSMLQGLAGMVGIITMMTSMSLILSKFNGKGAKGIGQMIIMAGAVALMAIPLKRIGEMDVESMILGLAGVVSMISTLTLMSLILSRFTGDGGIKGAGQMVLMAGSVYIIGQSMIKIAELSWEQMAKGLIGITGATTLLISAVGILSSKKVSVNPSAMLGLITVTASVYTLGKVMKQLSELSWTEIGKGLTGIGASLTMLVLALNLIKGPGSMAGAASLILASTSLLIFGQAIESIGSLKTGTIIKGLLGIAGAFAVLGVAGALLTPVIPSILALSGAMALMGIAVVAFSAGLAAISGSLVAAAKAIIVSLEILIVGLIDLVGSTAESLTLALIAIAEIFIKSIPVIAEALFVLGRAIIEVVVQLIPEIVAGIVKLVTGIADALGEHVPVMVNSIFDFLVKVLEAVADKVPELVGVIAKIVDGLVESFAKAMTDIDTGKLIGFITGLGAFTILFKMLAGLVTVTPAAMAGVLALGLLIAELGLVLAAFGGLAQIPGLTWIIGEGGNLLGAIGTALGQFAGGLVGGIGKGLTSSLPEIGKNLKDFAWEIQPFLDTMAKVDTKGVEGVNAVAQMMATITKGSIMDGIVSWFSGGESSIPKFAESIIPFGNAIVEFSQTVDGKINASAVEAAANAGRVLSEMAKTIPNSGGVAGFFAGNNDISSFGAKLVMFGNTIVSFSQTVTGRVNEAAIQAASNAGLIMTELANAIPNSGGLAGFFAGNNDIDEFARQIVPFGRAISEFSMTVTGKINQEAIQAAVNAGLILAELALSIPKINGLSQALSGTSDLDIFGSQLKSFGQAMVDFSNSVSGGIDSTAIQNAAVAGQALSDLASTIPSSGGLFSVFSGSQDLGSFGTQLLLYGSAIKAFSNEVSGLNYTDVSTGVTAGKLIGTLSSVSVDGGIFSSSFNPSTFSGKILEFARGIKAFSSEMAGFKPGALGEQISIIRNIMEDMKTVAVNGIEAINTTFTTAGPKFTATMNTSITQAVVSLNDKTPAFVRSGEQFVVGMDGGMKSKQQLPVTTATTMVSNVATALTSGGTSRFYNAGAMVATGFAKGITANTFRASAAASAMASSALTAARARLDVNSPSREFFKIGDYSGQGLGNGLLSWIPKIKNIGTKVADTTLSGFNGVVSAISGMIDSDMDVNPVVKPVLDLSNIKTGAGSIKSMFGLQPSIKAMSDIGVIDSGMSRRRGTGNADVVTAIKKLETKMGETSGDHYNIGGVTYEEGSAVANAMESLVRAIKVERRI